MKMSWSRRLSRAVLTFAFLAVVSPPSFAGAVDAAGDDPYERGVDAGRLWKEKLGLSTVQVRKLSALENEKAARIRPLRELLRNGMVQLQTQLAENAPENDVRDTLQQVLQIQRAIAERSERFDAGLASFLSPSQRARLLVWRSLGGLNGYAARRFETAGRQEPLEMDFER